MNKIRHCVLPVLVLATAFALACNGGGSPQQTELEQNRNLWNDQNIAHYSYQLRVGCFCPPDVTRPVNIEVQDNIAVSRAYADTGESPSADRFTDVDTIDKIFDVLEADINEADEVTVEYDARYGFPVSIQVDRIKDAIDDEIAYTVTDFEALP